MMFIELSKVTDALLHTQTRKIHSKKTDNIMSLISSFALKTIIH